VGLLGIAKLRGNSPIFFLIFFSGFRVLGKKKEEEKERVGQLQPQFL
jgi:hypothetical protein